MTESRDQRLDRSATADQRPLIPYAHTPSLVTADGLTGGAADLARRHLTRTTAGRRPRRLWRRLGAAALLTATLATGSALPAQAAAADAARASGVATVSAQHATLTAPVELSRAATSLPPRKGRG